MCFIRSLRHTKLFWVLPPFESRQPPTLARSSFLSRVVVVVPHPTATHNFCECKKISFSKKKIFKQNFLLPKWLPVSPTHTEMWNFKICFVRCCLSSVYFSLINNRRVEGGRVWDWYHWKISRKAENWIRVLGRGIGAAVRRNLREKSGKSERFGLGNLGKSLGNVGQGEDVKSNGYSSVIE